MSVELGPGKSPRIKNGWITKKSMKGLPSEMSEVELNPADGIGCTNPCAGFCSPRMIDARPDYRALAPDRHSSIRLIPPGIKSLLDLGVAPVWDRVPPTRRKDKPHRGTERLA